MKADVISETLRRIRYLVLLPIRCCIAVILAFCFKPYPPALKEFGIRVVALKGDGTWDNHTDVCVALEMLNQYDKEKLELVKRHIRIIFLGPMKNYGCSYLGTGVCLLNLEKIPVEMSTGQRVIAIIGWLVHEATRAKFSGELRAYLRTSKEVQKICKEEQQRTLQKINDECSSFRH